MKRSDVIETAISTRFFDTDTPVLSELATYVRVEFLRWLPWVCLHTAKWNFRTYKKEIGDVIIFSDSMYGINSVRAQVVSRTIDAQNEEVEMTLVFRNSAGGPSSSVTHSWLQKLDLSYILELTNDHVKVN